MKTSNSLDNLTRSISKNFFGHLFGEKAYTEASFGQIYRGEKSRKVVAQYDWATKIILKEFREYLGVKRFYLELGE